MDLLGLRVQDCTFSDHDPKCSGNAKTVAYSYTANNDLLTLNHSFTGSTANFTYTYNNVHQPLTTTSISAPRRPFPTPPIILRRLRWRGRWPIRRTWSTNTPTSPGSAKPEPALGLDPRGTNGNLTNDGTNAFTYNTENHLLTATIGGNVQSYSYDPLGRRKQKIATGPFAGTTSFLHDGNQEIAEYDGAGALLRRYVYGPGIDEPIATVDGSGTRSYHHQDGLGSVIALPNGVSGAVTASFTHGPCSDTPNPTGTAYRYTGRRIDSETELYYYRARYTLRAPPPPP